MVVVAVLVAVSMTATLSVPKQAAQARSPSGVIAISHGPLVTLIVVMT